MLGGLYRPNVVNYLHSCSCVEDVPSRIRLWLYCPFLQNTTHHRLLTSLPHASCLYNSHSYIQTLRKFHNPKSIYIPGLEPGLDPA